MNTDISHKLLENILDKFDNKELYNDIFKQSRIFGYTDIDLFNIDIQFMLNNLYNIKIIEKKKIRMEQSEFRKKILENFNNTCIITGQNCIDELEAAHIIPVSENENYDIDNGLLLSANIHKTFDKYLWSINPDTLMIDIKSDINVGTINLYCNKPINIIMTNLLYQNLSIHYNRYKLKNTLH